MTRRLVIALAAVTAVAAVGPALLGHTGRALAQQPQLPPYSPRPDLFYNFYVGPSNVGGVPAQLYVSPRPTPPVVGHTYITYQPLMPHEFLYRHKRVYIRRHPGGGITKTKVKWR